MVEPIEPPDLTRESPVWVRAKIVDPPDHNGFVKVAIPTGFIPPGSKGEELSELEVHATCLRGFPRSKEGVDPRGAFGWE